MKMLSNNKLFSDSYVLEPNEAIDFLSEIENARNQKDPSFEEYYTSMINDAVKYTNVRCNWNNLAIHEKIEKDPLRTRLHNAFISDCDIIDRLMKGMGLEPSWRERLGEDRKRIGDFACWICSIVAIRAR